MSTYFTIGEISKFSNISIKILRYYDKIGLLKQAYINKENKYRYYILNSECSLELVIDNIILDLENKQNEVYVQMGSTVPYKVLKNENKIIYKGIKAFCKDENNSNILPKGEYVTLIFEGSLKKSLNHYKKILDYIKVNNIEVVGDFNEIWLMPKIDENLEERSLVKIEILKK